MSRPPSSPKPSPEVTYRFSGNIESIYASLVVRLSYTEYFLREEQWRYSAEFSREGARLGFHLKHCAEDRGELEIYFFPEVTEFDRVTFIRFITDHLKAKGIEIEEEIKLICNACKNEVSDREAIDARVKAGRLDIPCQFCDFKIIIPRSIEEKYQTDHSYKSKQIELKGRAKKRTNAEIEEFRSDSQFYSPKEFPEIVNILHLSDIHLGTKEEALKYFGQTEVDVSKEQKIDSLDFLVISGDIANYSTETEYEAAFHFIDRVLKRFSMTPDRLILVPGNHDLSWELSKKSYSFVFRDSGMGAFQPDVHIPAGEEGWLAQTPDLYKRRFDVFNSAFYKKVYQGREFPTSYLDQAFLWTFDSEKILFLGLNSAWQIDHNKAFQNRSSVNIDSIVKALDQADFEKYADYLKMVVCHHPISGPEAMKDLSFLESLTLKGFQVYLHGHIHEAINGYHKYDDSRGIFIVGAGTFGAPTRQLVPGTPFQYNLLQIKKDTGRIKVNTRRKEKVDGAWFADARWGNKNSPKPFYNINLKKKKTK